MSNQKYETLKIKNQICFPLYACSKEIIKQYKPFLDEIGLTYTQYITMMVLWEHKSLTVKELGKCLYLDSGTLTPLLKKLESKGFITRNRSESDERNVIITITESGMQLRDQAVSIPEHMSHCTNLEPEEAKMLYQLLYKILSQVE